MKLIRICLILAVAVLSVSCASSPEPTPSEYHKGAYRPVRPPVFSPTKDAPHTFRPGQPSPVQPGPVPPRVLPQTPETRTGPGFWAVTPPVASADDGPVFAGVLFPHPGSAAEYGVRDKIFKCSTSLSDALDPVGITARVLRLKPEARYRCMVAHLFQACAKFLNDLARIRQGLPAQDVQDYATMLGIASTFLELECVDVDLTDEMLLIRNDGGRKWTEHLKKNGFRKR